MNNSFKMRHDSIVVKYPKQYKIKEKTKIPTSLKNMQSKVQTLHSQIH